MGVFAPNIEYRVEPDADWIKLCAVHKGGAFGTDFRMLVDPVRAVLVLAVLAPARRRVGEGPSRIWRCPPST